MEIEGKTLFLHRLLAERASGRVEHGRNDGFGVRVSRLSSLRLSSRRFGHRSREETRRQRETGRPLAHRRSQTRKRIGKESNRIGGRRSETGKRARSSRRVESHSPAPLRPRSSQHRTRKRSLSQRRSLARRLVEL